MKENFWRTFGWSFLVTIILITVALVMQYGDEVISGYFQGSLISFLFIVFIGIAALGMVLFLFKFQASWFRKSSFRSLFEKWPLDIRLILLFITFCFIYFFLSLSKRAFYGLISHSQFFSIQDETQTLLLLTFSLWASIYQLVWVYEETADGSSFWRKLKDGPVVNSFRSIKDAFSKASIGIRILWVLIVVFFWGIGTFLALSAMHLLPLYLLCVLLIGIPSVLLLFIRVGYLNRVLKATEQMAAGTLHEPIPVKGKSSVAKHAGNLNKLQQGMRHSLTEQAKSERLKTELITNVSHDLRTPLTSIITYTDLLKNPDLTEEERADYITVLDHKSQRLKTLIEDLFEVSKMASGNMELQKQRVDFTQLLQQALAEHEAEIAKSAFDFRVNMPETPLFVYVDGNKWWRLLDNLIVNALKYALPGTRIFIQLQEKQGNVQFVIKNITKYELEENVEELLERFKRADTSRHTEGSGLGLAIAQSIVDLHGGRMNIEIDGDLFKVTVEIIARG